VRWTNTKDARAIFIAWEKFPWLPKRSTFGQFIASNEMKFHFFRPNIHLQLALCHFYCGSSRLSFVLSKLHLAAEVMIL